MSFLFYSPMEQFEIPSNIFNIFWLWFFLLGGFLIIIMKFLRFYKLKSFFLNQIFFFFNSSLKILNLKLIHYRSISFLFSAFFLTFSVIAILNTLSSIPFTFAITSISLVPIFFSSFFFLLTFFNALGYQRFSLWQSFLPSGCPLILVKFLSIMEVVSFLARLISLAFRLLANVISGHTLLKILLTVTYVSFFYSMLNLNLVVSITVFVTFCVICLELLIGFLQAFVFVFLALSYLSAFWLGSH